MVRNFFASLFRKSRVFSPKATLDIILRYSSQRISEFEYACVRAITNPLC